MLRILVCYTHSNILSRARWRWSDFPTRSCRYIFYFRAEKAFDFVLFLRAFAAKFVVRESVQAGFGVLKLNSTKFQSHSVTNGRSHRIKVFFFFFHLLT